MTSAELKNYLDRALGILNILKRFIPGSIDDRATEYIQAVHDSDELVRLIAEDITNIGGLEAITVQPDGTLSLTTDAGNVPEGAEAARFDGSRLKKLIEMLPMLLELFKVFGGLSTGGNQ